jgi:zinc transport system substrate-binding protein
MGLAPAEGVALPSRRLLLAALVAVVGMVAAPPPSRAEEDGAWAVASIKPIHSLLAGVMAGAGAPALLVKGHASPHSFALKPSDAVLLERARIVFWAGPALERFLQRPLAGIGDARTVALLETPGLTLLPVRHGGLWEAHDDEHAGGLEESTAEPDGHFWLDPANAKQVVMRMARELAAVDPDRTSLYEENAAALAGRLDALDAELAAMLAPVATRPFIVFHDAYQYFERRYGLAGVGSITLDPDQPPGAETLAAIQGRLADGGAVCVFHEPQYPAALVETVAEGTGARVGELDPEGAALADGPELYFTLLRNLAAALVACLAG